MTTWSAITQDCGKLNSPIWLLWLAWMFFGWHRSNRTLLKAKFLYDMWLQSLRDFLTSHRNCPAILSIASTICSTSSSLIFSKCSELSNNCHPCQQWPCSQNTFLKRCNCLFFASVPRLWTLPSLLLHALKPWLGLSKSLLYPCDHRQQMQAGNITGGWMPIETYLCFSMFIAESPGHIQIYVTEAELGQSAHQVYSAI